jgi:carbonic anhydrase
MRFRLILLCALVIVLPIWALAAGAESNFNPQDALDRLIAGNARFAAGQPEPWHATSDLRSLLALGQHPLACVITCADSRVVPELLFDQSLGDLFVCRVAGNVVTPEITGSIDYAVDHLEVPLVVVLGHTRCGAVNAAIADPEATGPIGSVISRIVPSVNSCLQGSVSSDDLLNCAVSTNANIGCLTLLQNSHIMQEAVKSGRCMLISATYDIETGLVEWQTQLAAVNTTGTGLDQAATTPKVKKTEPKPATKQVDPKPDTYTSREKPERPAPTPRRH